MIFYSFRLMNRTNAEHGLKEPLKEKNMKILVIEDSARHQESARQTLVGHDVTIVGSFDEALGATAKYYDYANKKCKAVLTKENGFDAVLIDLMMPVSNSPTLIREPYKPDDQAPYGMILALLAAERGAKYVAVVTDTNHHDSPMSNAFDQLGPSYYRGSRIIKYTINGAICTFVHTPFIQVSDAGVRPGCEMRCICKGDALCSKDWGRVLRDLMSTEPVVDPPSIM